MVRRVEPNDDALVWCRKCSGCAVLSGSKVDEPAVGSEEKDTKEHGTT